MALNRMNCFSNLKNLEKPRKMPKGAKSPKSHDRLFGLLFGGGSGVQTHGTLACSVVFKTRSFDHSDIPPEKIFNFPFLKIPLELPLEPPVLPSCGMPGKSRSERVSGALPSVVGAKFQDRPAIIASNPRRVLFPHFPPFYFTTVSCSCQ